MGLLHVLLLLLLSACACVALCACSWGSVWSGVLVSMVTVGCALSWARAQSSGGSVHAEGRGVLITGCDSGFGHALALRLSARGLQVFAGVLDPEDPGAQSLSLDPGGIRVLHMDVTEPQHIAQARARVEAELGDTGLWGLVNNAGLLLCPVDAELHPTSCFRRLMEVNFLSAVAVTQAFLPLIRRARGRVVNMSSLAGEVTMPRFSAYSSSKAALACFSRVLRLEMLRWGVHVCLIQPSGFKTKIFSSDTSCLRQELLSACSPDVLRDYGSDYISHLPSSLDFMSQNAMQDISPVLDCMEHALLSRYPRALYCPGPAAWLLPFLQRHLPTAAFDWIITRFIWATFCPSAAPRL